jgi:hypothetical protein
MLIEEFSGFEKWKAVADIAIGRFFEVSVKILTNFAEYKWLFALTKYNNR